MGKNSEFLYAVLFSIQVAENPYEHDKKFIDKKQIRDDCSILP
jgi:hypothetical protein